ncbi:MAG: Do family serine endopeptidase [Chryseolinea sp.]
MKRFGSLFIAAVLGSLCTVASFQWLDKDDQHVKLDYMASVPASKVAYRVNEDGKAVPLDFTTAAEQVTPGVVFIKSTQESGGGTSQDEEVQGQDPFREFFGPRGGQRGPVQSSGSGVLINENGYIVTNNHVVDGADVVEVTLYDNRTLKAEVIGTDPDTDIALIKINAKGLPHLSFVDSDKPKVGEWVLAVGNPYNLTSTVTAGIISAKGRNINILRRNNGEGSTAIESFIQTDAAINPGNSGGALVDLNGGLLGINTAIASQTGSYTGYGFAVPSNIVSKIVEDLIKFGTVQRGWLGVVVQSVNSDYVKEKELKVNEGAYVSGFADKSSAKEAGMKEGDVVVKIDEAPIKSSTALIEYIGRHRPGDKVNMVVDRKGSVVTIPVTLKNREGNTTAVSPAERDVVSTLGVQLEELDGKVLKKLDIEHGVRVKELGTGKLAKYTDMRKGFILTKINDVPVKSVKEFTDVIRRKKQGDLVIFSGTYEDLPREFNYALRM